MKISTHYSLRSNYVLYAAFYEHNFSQKYLYNIIIKTCSASPEPRFWGFAP